ncbi:MAG TPA: hypothetical protein VF824_01815 [Thermoanaerobaculia bacterium]|jgi:hypothetical protein
MRARVVAGGAILLALAWWLFGFTTYREGPFTTTLYRRWGRVTRIDMSANDARQITHERILFKWSDPYEPGDPTTSCAAIPSEVWQDRNRDGKWDTWLFRTSPNAHGDCSIEYRVDLTNDGHPDWQFTSAFGKYEEARAGIVRRRGY